jgi:hypothetical protein
LHTVDICQLFILSLNHKNSNETCHEEIRSELHKMDQEDKETFQGATFPIDFCGSNIWDGLYTQQSY